MLNNKRKCVIHEIREVKVPVLDISGLFMDYDFHKVTALSAD